MATVETLPVLDPQTAIGRGGFGELFPDPRDRSRCIKVLNNPLTGPAAAGIIRLVDVLKWACPSDASVLTGRFAWPVEVFGATDSIVGFAMPLAPTTTRFSLTAGRRTSEVDLQAKYLMDSAYWNSAAIRSAKPDFSTGDRIEILLDLAYSVLVLHRNGLTYGDISSNNVAVRAEETPGVFLFDADSIVPVSEREASPLVSPGWEVTTGLDPLEIDRARIAVFALRLFVEQPSVAPTDEIVNAAGLSVGSEAARRIALAVESGGVQEFDEMLQALRARRTPARRRAAFDAAVESRVAKWVLRESDHAENAADRRVVDEALSQVSFENTLMGLGGKHRRQAMKRNSLARSGFDLDIPPVVSLPNPPTTEAALKELVFDAMFEEIASHLTAEGLGSLEQFSWTDRAVQRALIEGEDPQVQIRHTPGEASVRVWWPIDQFVNVIRLRIRHPSGTFESELRRGDADAQMVRSIDLPAGGHVHIEVCAGAVSPNGTTVWSPRPVTEEVNVAPLPRPDRPRVSAHVSSPVFDPEAERQRLLLERFEQERLEAEAAQRRRRKRQKIAAVCLLVFALGTAGSWWLFIRGTDYASGYLDRIDPTTYDRSRPVSDIKAEFNGHRIDLTWRFAVDQLGNRPDQYRVIASNDMTGTTSQVIVRDGTSASVPVDDPGTIQFGVGPEWFGSADRGVVAGPTIAVSPAMLNGARFLPATITVGLDENGLYVSNLSSEVGPGNAQIRLIGPDDNIGTVVVLAAGRTDLPAIEPGTWNVSILLTLDGGSTRVPLASIEIPADHPSFAP